MNTRSRVSRAMYDAVENMDGKDDLLMDYVVECRIAAHRSRVPVRWPYSNAARKALSRILVACGMNPSMARRVSSKMSLRQIVRAAGRYGRSLRKGD